MPRGPGTRGVMEGRGQKQDRTRKERQWLREKKLAATGGTQEAFKGGSTQVAKQGSFFLDSNYVVGRRGAYNDR